MAKQISYFAYILVSIAVIIFIYYSYQYAVVSKNRVSSETAKGLI